MADYWAHWLEVGAAAEPAKLPRIFYVNWFRKGPDGKFLWPGFGENSRVLEWVFERCEGSGDAVESPIGYLPGPTGIPTDGLDVSRADLDELLRVDVDEWRDEVPLIEAFYDLFGEHVPAGLRDELAELEKRLDG
jgi:phosphoenolpyruvate carboxykinase (GTP)